jgi:methionine aminopeptidase
LESLDQNISAQKEHTILITEKGFEILTIQEEEKIIFNL